MARYIRNTAILAGVQSAIGTELTTMTGSANAILVSNVSITALDAQNVDRALMRPYFGASEMLVGTASKKVEFEVELAGTGVTTGSGTAPAYDALLQACAFVGVGSATPSRFEYSLLSTTLKAATIYVYDDGVLHKYIDAMGDAEFMLGIGEKPRMKFTFTAQDGGDTAASNPSVTLTAFKVPLVVTNANTGDVTLGGTYTTGAITGGTAYSGTGIQSLKMGNSVSFIPMLGGDTVDITDRSVTGSMEFDLTAANEVAFMASVRANTLQSVSLIHGTAVGAKALIFMPAVQLISPKKIDKNGRRLIGFDFRALPVSGGDEFRLVLL